MVSGFSIHKRYNAQLLNALRELRDDAAENGFESEIEEMLFMASDFAGIEVDGDTPERILRDVIEETKDLILEEGHVFFYHLPTGDPMKLERPDVARIMVLSAAANYAVEQWLSKYSHDQEQAERDGAHSVVDLDNLAAMLDRHVRRQLVHYNILD